MPLSHLKESQLPQGRQGCDSVAFKPSGGSPKSQRQQAAALAAIDSRRDHRWHGTSQRRFLNA